MLCSPTLFDLVVPLLQQLLETRTNPGTPPPPHTLSNLNTHTLSQFTHPHSTGGHAPRRSVHSPGAERGEELWRKNQQALSAQDLHA